VQFRRVVVLVILVAVYASVLLTASVAAQAQSWKVKDASGHTQGSVVTTGTRTADILDLSGSRPGDMWFMSSADMSGNPAFWVLRYWLSDGVNYGTYGISLVRSGRCYLWQSSAAKVGLAVRTASRWVVSRHVSGKWRRVGSAPLGCPGQYALGAVRMLCW